MEHIITQILTGFKMQDTGVKIAKFREFVNKSFWFLVCVISILIAFFAGRTTKFMENRPNFYFESKVEETKFIDKNFEVICSKNGVNITSYSNKFTYFDLIRPFFQRTYHPVNEHNSL